MHSRTEGEGPAVSPWTADSSIYSQTESNHGFKKFESLECLIATTILVLQFCETLLNRYRGEEMLDSDDLKSKAEDLWISECQQAVGTDKNFQHWRRQLDIFPDDNGLLRCRGRIQNAAVPYQTKHPILLPRDHHDTLLLVRRAHYRVLHNGVKETLTELWSNFWIIKGRILVKNVIHRCRICRRYEGKPYGAPRPPPSRHFALRRHRHSLPQVSISLDPSMSGVKPAPRRSGFVYTHVV